MLENLISFDKDLLLAINGINAPFWDAFMWNYSQMITWLPLVIALLYVIYRNNYYTETLVIIVSLAVAFVLADQISSGFFKPVFQRFRPTHDPEILETVRIVNGYRGGLYGFVSSHAANSFAAVMFCILLFRNRLTSVLLILWACVNCYSRMYLGVHFPGDIVCGTLVGLLSGYAAYLVYKLLKRKLLKMPGEHVYNGTSVINYVLGLTVVFLVISGFTGFYI